MNAPKIIPVLFLGLMVIPAFGQTADTTTVQEPIKEAGGNPVGGAALAVGDVGTVEVRPVRATGAEGFDWIMGPGPREITLFSAGQLVAFDVFISDWDPAALALEQIDFNCSYFTFLGGQLSADAVESCGEGGAIPGFCWEIDTSRPDYIFAGLPSVGACESTVSCPEGRGCGATLLFSPPVADPGVPRYAMTVVFLAVDAGIGSASALIDPLATSFLNDATGSTVGPNIFLGATVTFASTCGLPTAGSCCDPAGTGTPGCADTACCSAVCACDPFCCEANWDELCAGPNTEVPGCSALDLCTCTVGTVEVRPVRASGAEGVHWILGPGPREITLFTAGQFVTFDVFISDWDPVLLTAEQLDFNCSYFTFLGGEIAADGVERCGDDGAIPGFCWEIDKSRPDYIFASGDSFSSCQIADVCPGVRSCADLVVTSPVADPGVPRYAMTVVYWAVDAGTGSASALIDPLPTSVLKDATSSTVGPDTFLGATVTFFASTCGLPAAGSCCDPAGTGTPGCDDTACCSTVCACDPFCCEAEWDSLCAGPNVEVPGCSAQDLCTDACHPACGIPAAGDCCDPFGTGTPGCADTACCNTVCACDPFCCEAEWDFLCAGPNLSVPGCSALELCTCGVDPPLTGPNTYDRTLQIILPASSANAASSVAALTAYRVTLVTLYNPSDPQPIPPQDFSGQQGTVRYLNLLRKCTGAPSSSCTANADCPAGQTCEVVTDCVSSAAQGTTYPCITVGCVPEFVDWGALFGGRTAYVSGNAIIPDSGYTIAHLAASCTVANAATCSAASAEVAFTTARSGDAQPDGLVGVADVVLTVDAVKQLPDSAWEYQVYIRQQNPAPQIDATGVGDIVAHVDALKLFAYQLPVLSCP